MSPTCCTAFTLPYFPNQEQYYAKSQVEVETQSFRPSQSWGNTGEGTILGKHLGFSTETPESYILREKATETSPSQTQNPVIINPYTILINTVNIIFKTTVVLRPMFCNLTLRIFVLQILGWFMISFLFLLPVQIKE